MKVLCIEGHLYSPTPTIVEPIVKEGCIFYVLTEYKNEHGLVYVLCEQPELWYLANLFIPCSDIDERELVVNKKEVVCL